MVDSEGVFRGCVVGCVIRLLYHSARVASSIPLPKAL